MARRYSYTPRRSGKPASPGPFSVRLFSIALIVLALVAFGGWLIFRGGSTAADPQGQSLALPPVTSVSPTVAAAQATPRRTVKPTSPPVITGLAATIIEEPCGKVLYAFNEHTHYPPASLTKIDDRARRRRPRRPRRTVDLDRRWRHPLGRLRTPP